MNTKSYYNTTSESGKQLRQNIRQALRQDDKVLEFFKFHPDNEFTPFEVAQAVFDEHTPITSVRRSITNLTKKGILEETTIKREGIHGRANICWKFHVPKPPVYIQEELFPNLESV